MDPSRADGRARPRPVGSSVQRPAAGSSISTGNNHPASADRRESRPEDFSLTLIDSIHKDMNNNRSPVHENSKYFLDEELKSEGDNRSLLPTDAQLDRFVDSVCENFSSLQVENPVSSSAVLENYEFNARSCSPKLGLRHRGLTSISSEMKNADSAESRDSFSPYSSLDSPKIINQKKSTPTSNLNIAIIQCTRSLELLIERRKNLESLIRRHHNMTNINYNVPYTPRLPDAPTRVDRLLYDVNQERCRIVSLMTVLEKTINSFSSKTAKEVLRQLLVAYGKAIVDVIKERQKEVNSNSGCSIIESGVNRLIELIDELHCMNRHVHTALWCIEVKDQFNLVMSRRRTAKSSQSVLLERKPQETIILQKSWTATKLASENPSSHSLRFSSAPCCAGFKSGVNPLTAAQPQNVHQMMSPPAHPKKSTTFQLFGQQQRAEVCQRFSSTLKQSL